MKQLTRIAIGVLFIGLLINPSAQAQNDKEAAASPSIIAVTTVHWNFEIKDGSQEEWLKIEKEYFEKVTMKNEFILGTNFLTHYFTADNTEAIAVAAYENLAAINKAADRTAELIEAGWPDEDARKAFMDRRNEYYTSLHSDEIYRILDGAKYMQQKETEPLVYYVRKSQLAFPADGKNEELKKLHADYLENVIYKNTLYQGYFIYRHGWGADSRDLLEVFVVNSMADIEASFDENQKLTEAFMNEEERKAFFKAYNKYWTGIHGDYVYRSVPELIK